MPTNHPDPAPDRTGSPPGRPGTTPGRPDATPGRSGHTPRRPDPASAHPRPDPEHPRPAFDFHVRLRPTAGAVADLLRAMDAHGIGRALVCAGGTLPPARISRQVIEGGGTTEDADNGAVRAACAAHPRRLVPCYFANPHRPVVAYRAAAPNFRAVEVSPAVHGVPLADPRTDALVAVAGEVGHSVYAVCLQQEGSGVADLARLAARHPEVTFVLGHCGIGNIDLYGLTLVRDLPNVLVETSGGYTLVLRAALAELGPDRVLFGSEYPLQDPAVELAKYAVLGLPPDMLRGALGDNARRVLKEPAARR
ncbi:amidohydrolase family protein [Streptomyces sp. NPDC003077]|uniref:amidohydrolase family protein n=1 Tax=Streptomyces sp. NPDC003077 TaxID=3154443 RepID=UPI0033A0213C